MADALDLKSNEETHKGSTPLSRTIKNMRYLLFRLRLFYRESVEKIRWKIAYLIPRKIAILVFVRVHSVLDYCPESYTEAYRLFESGKGK